MTKKTLLIILIFTCSLSYGQYDWTPGKVILKNGQTLKGLLKIPRVTIGLLSIPKSKLEYKKDKKGKKKKFDKTQVDKVYFGTSNPNVGYYEYVPISNKRMALFKLIRNGKVKLYMRTIKVGVNTGFQNQKKVKKRKEYYIIRENEKKATRVLRDWDGLSIGNLRSFKNYMKKYFSDCPNIVTYIKNDLYEDFDIAQIVDDYNLLCE
ncbi:hypothetical protein ES692_07015 [Psychroserpens burtonensis]|uniref:Uncharacterized protein n=1 Tax=Psychroserpens burtonensis TaxID=49278 RepID=A0A5C7BD09_9FLAO|nr:hypothetical protein [Psychroserpens burtonensis]TXE18390.1 hypothetical protein ES692_07015 [Psychroserpens burtonensis]